EPVAPVPPGRTATAAAGAPWPGVPGGRVRRPVPVAMGMPWDAVRAAPCGHGTAAPAGPAGAASVRRPGSGCRNGGHAGREDAPVVELLGEAGAVEGGGYAPGGDRPAGAEDHAQVDVLRRGDHALLEHDADLLGERAERAQPHLLGRGRAVAAGEDGPRL